MVPLWIGCRFASKRHESTVPSLQKDSVSLNFDGEWSLMCCVCMCVHAYTSVCMHSCICLSVCLSVWLPACLPGCLSVCLPACMHAYLPFHAECSRNRPHRPILYGIPTSLDPWLLCTSHSGTPVNKNMVVDIMWSCVPELVIHPELQSLIFQT